MSLRIDEILAQLANGKLSLSAACRIVAALARAESDVTRYWTMLVESRVGDGKIDASVGRALLDALECPNAEKTVWLAPSKRLSATDSGALSRSSRVDPPRPMPGTTCVLPPLMPGAILGNRYRLEAHLGRGGIGQVFDAVDLQAQRTGLGNERVTIKVVAVNAKREPAARYVLRTAATATKSLRHPNIVDVFSVECDQERLFVVMESLSGRWLGDLIREVRGHGLPGRIAWPIVADIAKGLAHAHQHDVVHSDLNPYAVFLNDDGRAKIMGFGWSRALPSSKETLDLLDTMTLRAYCEAYTADIWATHAKAQPSDDLYPLGVIAYELLAGKHPFQRQSLRMAQRNQLRLAPIKGLSRRGGRLIEHCLSFERGARPQSAARFLAALRRSTWLTGAFGRFCSPIFRRNGG